MSLQVATLSSQHVSLFIIIGKSHDIFILIHHTGINPKIAKIEPND